MADWLPTLYEAAGGDVTDYNLDGMSQLRAIQTDSDHPRDEVFHVSHHGRGILRYFSIDRTLF